MLWAFILKDPVNWFWTSFIQVSQWVLNFLKKSSYYFLEKFPANFFQHFLIKFLESLFTIFVEYFQFFVTFFFKIIPVPSKFFLNIFKICFTFSKFVIIIGTRNFPDFSLQWLWNPFIIHLSLESHSFSATPELKWHAKCTERKDLTDPPSEIITRDDFLFLRKLMIRVPGRRTKY